MIFLTGAVKVTKIMSLRRTALHPYYYWHMPLWSPALQLIDSPCLFYVHFSREKSQKVTHRKTWWFLDHLFILHVQYVMKTCGKIWIRSWFFWIVNFGGQHLLKKPRNYLLSKLPNFKVIFRKIWKKRYWFWNVSFY